MSLSYELRARMALEKYGFHTSHSLGQNFLFDEALLTSLLDRAEVGKGDRVLEIGPGAGMMTALMADRCEKVLSVELDEKLRGVLSEVLGERDNVHVAFADAMRADLGALIREHLGEGKARVVANLPYYITTDMVMKLIGASLPITDVCVMVQKEAAQRLLSRPGGKQWCAAAAMTEYFGRAEVLQEVSRNCFEPAPHVDSAFVRISLYENKPVQALEDRQMIKTIHAAFLMRRKKLTNNLKSAFSLTQEEAASVLAEAGVDPDVRGEALEIEQLVRVSDALTRRFLQARGSL